MHVLSTPPAFVLSQDQTLRRDQTTATRRAATRLARMTNQKHPEHNKTRCPSMNAKNRTPPTPTTQPTGHQNRQRPHSLLNLPLFRFQGAHPDTPHPPGRCPCRLAVVWSTWWSWCCSPRSCLRLPTAEDHGSDPPPGCQRRGSVALSPRTGPGGTCASPSGGGSSDPPGRRRCRSAARPLPGVGC